MESDRYGAGEASIRVKMRVACSAQPDPERDVIEAMQRGDRHAFQDFVRRQARWIVGVIFGVTGDRDRTEDVCQQVWLAVWSRIGELRDPDRWRPWLYRLAKNAAYDAGRAAARSQTVVRAIQNDPRSRVTASSPPDRLIGEERKQAMMTAIQSLPRLYREPFVLRHLEGLSYREIGGLMEMPVDTVETRLVRARRLLREMLEGKV